jgi:hypothetical protein
MVKPGMTLNSHNFNIFFTFNVFQGVGLKLEGKPIFRNFVPLLKRSSAGAGNRKLRKI